jgi:thioredoxin 2
MALAVDDRGVILICSSCGKRNRIPFGREAKCGHCGVLLPPPAEPLEIPSEAAFDALIRNARLPVVVDFWAPWCGPCHAVAPEIARVAASNAGRWVVAKVNTEALPDLATRFGIQSIPTMAVFAGGREVTRTLGARPAAAIEDFVNQAAGTTAGRR